MEKGASKGREGKLLEMRKELEMVRGERRGIDPKKTGMIERNPGCWCCPFIGLRGYYGGYRRTSGRSEMAAEGEERIEEVRRKEREEMRKIVKEEKREAIERIMGRRT